MFSDSATNLLSLAKIQQATAGLGPTNVLLILLGLAVAVVAVDYAWMLWLRSKMPPGPLPWPIVGNTYSLPAEKPWVYFEELAQKHKTPVLTFWIGR